MEENNSQYSSSQGGRLNHPDDLKKYFSSKTFKDHLLEKTNPLVYCTLTMEGKDFLEKSSYSVELHQKTNDHDGFTIIVPDDSLDSFEGYVMENSKNILGKRLTLNLHRFGEVKQLFTGIIANVKNKKENGYGKLYITRYGEYFYYNGQNLIFGNKVQPIVTLEENIDLIDVEFELKIKPQDFNYISYDTENGSKIEKDSSSAQIQYKENPFQAVAINASKNIYKKKPEMLFNHTGISSGSDKELKEAVRKEREKRENLMLVRGKSKDPELKIGGRAKLSDINGKAMETYRIIEIKHFHDGNTYYNEFVGIPDLFTAPYQDDEALPLGEKQSARVLDNNHPMGMGRVKVQFPWQEKRTKKRLG